MVDFSKFTYNKKIFNKVTTNFVIKFCAYSNEWFKYNMKTKFN